MVIGGQHVDEFLAFAAEYYREIEGAKSGLWMPQTGSYLER